MKAARYRQNRWSKPVTSSGHTGRRISTHLTDNAIRPFAVKRKTWLFSDSPSNARANVTNYRLIAAEK
ncbi:transposase [Vibrio cyclitrophicus]